MRLHSEESVFGQLFKLPDGSALFEQRPTSMTLDWFLNLTTCLGELLRASSEYKNE